MYQGGGGKGVEDLSLLLKNNFRTSETHFYTYVKFGSVRKESEMLKCV